MAMAEGAELVSSMAKERAPVETGALKAAIHVERNDQAEYSVVAGNRRVFYGHIVEHGSVHAGAQPFLIPALEDTRAMIDKLIQQALPEE